MAGVTGAGEATLVGATGAGVGAFAAGAGAVTGFEVAVVDAGAVAFSFFSSGTAGGFTESGFVGLFKFLVSTFFRVNVLTPY